MGRFGKANWNRVLTGMGITLATCCYVLVDAAATEHIAAYERFEMARLALFWGLPVAVAFALGYWIVAGTAKTNALTETRLLTVVAPAGVVSAYFVAYAVGIPAGIVTDLSVTTAVVRTVVTAVFVALGATSGGQLVRVSTGDATVDWRLAAATSSMTLLAGLAGFVHYQQADTGFFFYFHGKRLDGRHVDRSRVTPESPQNRLARRADVQRVGLLARAHRRDPTTGNCQFE